MSTDSAPIVDLLVEEGRRLFDGPPAFVSFTKHAGADKLLNNLDEYPHAFVLGCVMDRQMKAERAWLIPFLLSQKLGGFEIERLCKLSLSDVAKLMTSPEPLHRFLDEMSKNFHAAVHRIVDLYQGNAAKMWADRLRVLRLCIDS